MSWMKHVESVSKNISTLQKCKKSKAVTLRIFRWHEFSKVAEICVFWVAVAVDFDPTAVDFLIDFFFYFLLFNFFLVAVTNTAVTIIFSIGTVVFEKMTKIVQHHSKKVPYAGSDFWVFPSFNPTQTKLASGADLVSRLGFPIFDKARGIELESY